MGRRRPSPQRRTSRWTAAAATVVGALLAVAATPRPAGGVPWPAAGEGGRRGGGGRGGGGGGGGGGDDELSRLLDVVAAVGLSRRSAVLSVSRLGDADAKAARLRRMLADKAGMSDDPLAAGRAELAAAKREVERRDMLGGLDSGNIVSGGRRRRGAPVSYADPSADVLDKLLEEEEEERAEQQGGAAAVDGSRAAGKGVGRRVVGDGSGEEDTDTEGAKPGKTAVSSGEAGAPADQDATTVVKDALETGEQADGKASGSGTGDGSDAGDDADAGPEEREEEEDSDDDDDDDDFSAGDLSEDDA